jgi:hypothetical protein
MSGMVDEATEDAHASQPAALSLLLLAMSHAETFTAGELREISRSDAALVADS